jgi:hypothetical protein
MVGKISTSDLLQAFSRGRCSGSSAEMWWFTGGDVVAHLGTIWRLIGGVIFCLTGRDVVALWWRC